MSQATYIQKRNATELAYEDTEAQFYQSVYSCTQVPYYDDYTSESLTYFSTVAAHINNFCLVRNVRTVRNVRNAYAR